MSEDDHDQVNDHDHDHDHDRERDEAGLIRAFCDGELELEEGVVVQRRVSDDPELAGRVRFEKSMRDRVGKVMSADLGDAPAELRERCAEVMSAAAAKRGVADAGDDAGDDAGQRRSWLTGPPRANAFAVVASLTLIGAAVLFGIFGSPIDTIRVDARADLVSESAAFVASEHTRCAASSGNRDAKTAWRSTEAASAGLARHLGSGVPILPLDELGYRFVGAGECHLPGPAASAHLVYTRRGVGEDGCPEAMLSLFVVPDVGQFDLVLGRKLGQWEWIKAGTPPNCAKRVACTTDGTNFYFLVCCDEGRLPALADLMRRHAP